MPVNFFVLIVIEGLHILFLIVIIVRLAKLVPFHAYEFLQHMFHFGFTAWLGVTGLMKRSGHHFEAALSFVAESTKKPKIIQVGPRSFKLILILA
jgi:hypothetical protein